MAPLCIGSKALFMINPEARDSHLDIDVMCRLDDFIPFVQSIKGSRDIVDVSPLNDGLKVMARLSDGFVVEAELAWEGSLTERLYEFGLLRSMPICSNLSFATLDFLYLLKMSHRFKKNSPHFLKTMRDIQFMRKLGASIPDTGTKYGQLYNELYELRMKETYSYKHPNLMQNKSGFFDASVPYQYDHDSIHEAIAVLDRPAYDIVKGESHEVFMRKRDFFAAPREIQLLCSYEEACVLSLERSIIPFDITDQIKQKEAFDYALMKVCTSITSGFFREFSWENYDVVQSMYDSSYISKFKVALSQGRIRPYKVSENG